MSSAFWIKRFLLVLVIAFAIIVAGQLVQQRTLEHALIEGALWAPVAAAIFVGVAFARWRRSQACAMCNDIPSVPGSRPGTDRKS